MKVALYLYDGYYETEICIPTLLFKDEELFTFSIDQDIVKCVDGKKVVADFKISELDPKEIDVLIIPGGKPILKEEILNFIKVCDDSNTIIGGICGGVHYLAHSGILKGRRYTSFKEDVEGGIKSNSMYESDNKVVSAKPEAYLEFALELYQLAGFEISKEDEEDYKNWFKSPYCFKNQNR